jgi:UDP-glucuronate 4-epimerase
MSAHILVTGGAGFIGSHLTRRLLDRGDRVTILDDFNDFYDPARKRANVTQVADRDGFSMVEGDIRDAELVDKLFAEQRFDGVVHLAARAGVRPSLKEPILYEDTNCIGTLRLLEAARHHGPDTFIFGSSSSVYGINQKVPFSEEDAGELLCYNYHHLYDMNIACLRFFTVYGPAQRPEMAIHKFTDLLAKGEEIPMYGDGSSRRDYTFIDDIIDGVVASLDLAPPFEILNLGGAETTALADLVRMIAEELGVEHRVQYLPDQPGDVPITYADVRKAGRVLGYSPRVSIREGLRRFVEWYRENDSATPD